MTYAPQFKDKTIEQLQAMREKCAKRTGVLADPIMLNILDQELLSRALPPEPKAVTCPQCEGAPDLCNGYCEGTGQVTINHAEEWHRQNDDPTLSWKNDIPCYAPPDLDQEPHEDTPSLEDSGLSLGSYNS
jgi:hypothetical protein